MGMSPQVIYNHITQYNLSKALWWNQMTILNHSKIFPMLQRYLKFAGKLLPVWNSQEEFKVQEWNAFCKVKSTDIKNPKELKSEVKFSSSCERRFKWIIFWFLSLHILTLLSHADMFSLSWWSWVFEDQQPGLSLTGVGLWSYINLMPLLSRNSLFQKEDNSKEEITTTVTHVYEI